jgi:hypothetical protein
MQKYIKTSCSQNYILKRFCESPTFAAKKRHAPSTNDRHPERYNLHGMGHFKG